LNTSEDLEALVRREVAGGLVREDDRGVGDDRPGDRDTLLLAAGELGRLMAEAIAEPEALVSVREAVEAAGFTVEDADVTMIPKTTVAIDDESSAKKLVRLIEALEENDDVQDVYANFDIPERVLESAAS